MSHSSPRSQRPHATRSGVRPLLASTFSERPQVWMRPAPPPWIGPLLALAAAALYILTYAGTFTSRDGGVMYDTALALLNRHALRLPPHHHGLPGVGGGFYSKYGLAQSVAELPLLATGQALAAHLHTALAAVLPSAMAMLTVPLLTALAVWLFFLLCHEVHPDPRAAGAAALLLAVASPYWPYAKSDFSEPLSALALSGAVLFLVRARSRPQPLTFTVAGLFLALALLTKLTAGFILPVVALYALYVARVVSGRDWRALVVRLIAWVLPICAGLALDALYNLARYGHLTDTGYHADDLPFRAPLLTGLVGLLLSPGKGLLWYCPLVLLALLLWPRLLKRYRAEGLLVLGVILVTLGVFATYPVWWGGVCWGPRYLLPLLPLLLWPLAFGLEALPRSALGRRAIVAVVALSVLVQVVGVAVHPNRYLVGGVTDAVYLWRPSASPLLAEAWLAAYDAVSAVDHTDAVTLRAAYPWRAAGGLTAAQGQAIDGWPYWWFQVLHRQGLNRSLELMVATVLMLTLVLTLWGLRGLRYPATLVSPFDRRRMAVQGRRGDANSL